MEDNAVTEQNRDWLELSLAQQAIWLDAKLSGETLYQLGGWARVGGNLDEAAVRQSVSLVMARHDALRLRVDEEQPRQWLDSSVAPPVSVVELQVDNDPDASFQSHIENVFASPMPWGDHPLFHVQLIRATPDLCFLLWRFHHLLADSISTTITMSHWAGAYLALTSDVAPVLAPRSTYLRTIASDKAYLKSPEYKQDLSYWLSRFSLLPPTLIPTTDSRPKRQPQLFFSDWILEGDAHAQLEKAARGAGVPAQRALFALFTTILVRRFGQTDLVSGIALHRRDLSNRHVLGMLSGIIAVRFRLHLSWSLLEAVQAFSEQVDADLRHQRMPVDRLSRSLGLFQTGRSRLFEVVMSYIPIDRKQTESVMDGLPVITGVVALREISPISLHVTELPHTQGLAIRVCVNTDRLDVSEPVALLSLFQSALSSFVASPKISVQSLPSMTAAERVTATSGDWQGERFEEWTV